MAISSYGVTLKIGATAQGVTKVCDIKDIPDLIGEPNLLETTTLSDGQQTNIPGIKSSGVLSFTLNWDASVCQTLKNMEGTNEYYSLEFSDGTKFTWQGKHTLGVSGKGVDEVLEAVLHVVASTPITVSFPSSGQ